MFRPPYLQSGDKVALVSPAGIIDPLSIHDAVEVLRSWELNPIVGPNAAATYGYFAGRDEQRLHFRYARIHQTHKDGRRYAIMDEEAYRHGQSRIFFQRKSVFKLFNRAIF